MAKMVFTESEKVVIYGLTQNADQTDSALASRFGLKLSTVTSIRRRLMDSKHIPFVNFPAFSKLGCEMIVQLYGSTNPGLPPEIKDGLHLGFLDETPGIFDSISTEGFISMSGVFRDFSEFLLALDRYDRVFDGVHALEKANLSIAFFPFRVSRVCYWYNFAPGLHRIFNLSIPKPQPNRPIQVKVENVALSSIEKATLVKLIEYPNATDPELARLMGKSRQTAFNVRKRLMAKEMFRRVCVPLLFTWNIDFIAYVHIHFRPNIDPETRANILREDWMNLSWYTLERESEAFTAYIFRDYKDYAYEMQRMMKPLVESGVLKKEPHVMLVSTAAARELRDCSFAPLLRKLLGMTQSESIED
jgi:hypothetical protein